VGSIFGGIVRHQPSVASALRSPASARIADLGTAPTIME